MASKPPTHPLADRGHLLSGIALRWRRWRHSRQRINHRRHALRRSLAETYCPQRCGLRLDRHCGIRVCNTPGVNHDEAAEMTHGLTIMTARSLPSVIQSVKDGHWPRSAGREPGDTPNIIGYGPNGRAARPGSALEMRVLASTSYPDPRILVSCSPIYRGRSAITSCSNSSSPASAGGPLWTGGPRTGACRRRRLWPDRLF